jgi:DNA-binding NtrC family response regulator
MPPLRERREDIPLLAELFLARVGVAARARHAAPLERGARVLLAHDWPGNVRELANVIEGASLLATDGVLRPQHVSSRARAEPARARAKETEPAVSSAESSDTTPRQGQPHHCRSCRVQSCRRCARHESASIARTWKSSSSASEAT